MGDSSESDDSYNPGKYTPPHRPRFDLFRMWSGKLFQEFNFHTQTSYQLYTSLGLARLMYETANVPGGMNSLLRKTIMKTPKIWFVLEIKSINSAGVRSLSGARLHLTGVTIKCADIDQGNVNVIVEAHLATMMHKIVREGDYVFICGGERDPGVTGPCLTITLNGATGSKCVVLIYRHDGEGPTPSEEQLYRDQFSGGILVFSHKLYRNGEAIVHHVKPQSTSSPYPLNKLTQDPESEPANDDNASLASFETHNDNDFHLSPLDHQILAAPVMKDNGGRKSRIQFDRSDESNENDLSIPCTSENTAAGRQSSEPELSDDDFIDVEGESEIDTSNLFAEYLATPAVDDHNKSLNAKRKLEFQAGQGQKQDLLMPQPSTSSSLMPQPSTSSSLMPQPSTFSSLILHSSSDDDLAKKIKCKASFIHLKKNSTIDNLEPGQVVIIGRKGELKIKTPVSVNGDGESRPQRLARSRFGSTSTFARSQTTRQSESRPMKKKQKGKGLTKSKK